MNCSQGSSSFKDLKRHMKSHENVAVDINATKYICPSKVCNYETSLKRYFQNHMRRCKHANSSYVENSKSFTADKGLSNKDKEVVIEPKSERFQKVLCNISGCDFITDRAGRGQGQSKLEDHFRNRHKDKELSKDSFISLNSAMAEAMEILREIREINEKTR